MASSIIINRLKVALDTQILSYLIDNTYPVLTDFIAELASIPYVDLICSRFVIYELSEVRKREHYLREIHNESNSKGGVMSFSSVLKYRKDWSAPELDYGIVFDSIKKKVEDDIRKIYDDFGIDYQDVFLHKDLWKPHQDLMLSSKMSKEDSLVLLSSIYPNANHKENYLVFLTNDDGFYRGLCGKGSDRILAIDKVFKSNDLTLPSVNKLNEISTPITNRKLNLIKTDETEKKIKVFIKSYVFEHLKLCNDNLLLGTTIKCEAKGEISKTLLCFELFAAKELNSEVYVSILLNDLSELYVHPYPLKGFYCYGEINEFPYTANNDEKSRRISLKMQDDEGKMLDESLIDKISSPGNLIFINPDSFI